MDRHALDVLEFDQVRALLAEGAASDLGLAAIETLEPFGDPAVARLWLERTSEMRWLLDQGHDLPLGGLHDLTSALREARIGRALEPKSLIDVAETIRCTGRLRRFVMERERMPRLRELAEALVPREPLADDIERCIGDDGEVCDDASPELRRLRRAIRELAARVQTTLHRILGELSTGDAVQDAVVTIRQGRYCIPVKSSHQGQVQGLIHDRSGSGQTVFVEPAAVVRVNNELREAQFAEREEVARILAELTWQVAAEADGLEQDLETLCQLELARARGRLSVKLQGVEPVLREDGGYLLKEARHPLLLAQMPRGQVVPIDLQLGDEVSTILITGPNTGGKTIALKTVGLLTLMAQAGLHVPAEVGTALTVGRNVFADIGDEQSIEQSLSTFGAHLRQVVGILEGASEGDLVLLDEIGAGTDPTEGAALAEALLSQLHRRGCRTVATTHHGSLKRFAYETAGVENASVEFDGRSLAPTYRLLTGIPGASHAFEIAARYGLSETVLAQARELLPQDHVDAAELITEMRSRRQQLDTEVRAAEHEAAKVSHERRELERERKRLRELEVEIRAEARREADRLLQKVRDEAEQILTDLRKADREGRQTERSRQRLKGLQDEFAKPPAATAPRRPVPAARPAQPEFKLGDVVEVLSLGAEGEVVSIADDELEVRVGSMRVAVRPDEVTLVRRGDRRRETGGVRRTVANASGPDYELHVRGMTVEEAMAEVERYVDQAILANMSEIRIVHGKGTGTLKRAVQDYLKQHPYVKGFQHPPEHLGGRGVTVAQLTL